MRRLLPLSLAVALVSCATFGGSASDPSPGRVHGLERNYLFVSIPTSGLTFEGWISPHLPLLQNLPGQTELVLRPGRPEVWAYAITGTPLVRLRMYDEPSNPVRTPSYMPKVQGQLFRMRNRAPDRPESERIRGPVAIQILTATIGHHSNGQDGCLFDDEAVDATGDCVAVPPPTVPDDLRPVNKTDGSFSTNYLRLAYDHERVRIDADRPTDQQEIESVATWKVGGFVEWHPVGFLRAGAIEEVLHDIYGPVRLEGHYEIAARDRWRCAGAHGRLSLMYIVDAPADVSDVAVSAEGACVFRGTGWGVFARYYHGQDYYNLGFLENISRFQAGLTWDQERWLRFAISPF